MNWVTQKPSLSLNDKLPAPLPPVAVIATGERWCFGGKPVVEGKTYLIDPTTAQSLINVGKARPA